MHKEVSSFNLSLNPKKASRPLRLFCNFCDLRHPAMKLVFSLVLCIFWHQIYINLYIQSCSYVSFFVCGSSKKKREFPAQILYKMQFHKLSRKHSLFYFSRHLKCSRMLYNISTGQTCNNKRDKSIEKHQLK